MSFGLLSMRSVGRMAILSVLVLGTASAAHAQATRTWVSGVGDDANPCSRTAPCKTFAGAIAKTATNGYIDVLDPGGFGALTITKSITIDGMGGNLAGVLVSGTNGINITGTGIVVTLRNLSFEGQLGSGLTGINVISAAEVHIEHCVINGFHTAGIVINGATAVSIADTTVVDNTNGGVVIGSGRVLISNLHADSNANGVAVTGPALVTVRDSYASNNGAGFAAVVSPAAVLTCENCVTTNNQYGVLVNSGATLRLSNSVVSSNTTQGLSNDGASYIVSLQGNSLVGNFADGSFTSTTIKQ